MFKGMPKAFWIGLAIMYGYSGFFMMLEWTIPGFPLRVFLGIPACWIYNAIFGCFILNIFIAWYYAYSEEQREARVEAKKKSS
ncbi:MAG: hypothetical protein C0394_06665 [Syntrophus sp. (in: bacteria)]|nr:hypothetical protein [Syntrophus sp. (in: bacteria)]